MAMSLAQGGSGFSYLCPSVYQYLCGIKPTDISVSVDDIPDYEVKNAVQQVYYVFSS